MNNYQINDIKDSLPTADNQLKVRLENAESDINKKIDSLSDAAFNLLSTAGESGQKLQESASVRRKDVIRSTDQFVQDKPWKAVGISALSGSG